MYTPAEKRVITRALNIIHEKLAAYEGGAILNSPTRVREYIRIRLADAADREHFGVIFLNSQHAVLDACELFAGTLDGAAVYPRVLVRAVLERNAAAVILYHNHPSGVPNASFSDRRITEQLKAALALIDVRVLDHIIVGSNGRSFSFAEDGLV